MFLSRVGDISRCWFVVEDSNGALVRNIPTQFFTATIIDADDTMSTVCAVTQSNQKLGLYRFDISASFFISGGRGDYAIILEINSASVIDVLSHNLHVSLNDFDSLTGSIWTATASLFSPTGSMGYLQASIASLSSPTASVDVPTIVSGVWGAGSSGFTSAGTMGGLQNAISVVSSAIDTIHAIENGSWLISGSQLIMQASGTSVEVARFNLQDITGSAINPLTQSPFRRIRV